MRQTAKHFGKFICISDKMARFLPPMACFACFQGLSERADGAGEAFGTSFVGLRVSFNSHC